MECCKPCKKHHMHQSTWSSSNTLQIADTHHLHSIYSTTGLSKSAISTGYFCTPAGSLTVEDQGTKHFKHRQPTRLLNLNRISCLLKGWCMYLAEYRWYTSEVLSDGTSCRKRKSKGVHLDRCPRCVEYTVTVMVSPRPPLPS